MSVESINQWRKKGVRASSSAQSASEKPVIDKNSKSLKKETRPSVPKGYDCNKRTGSSEYLSKVCECVKDSTLDKPPHDLILVALGFVSFVRRNKGDTSSFNIRRAATSTFGLIRSGRPKSRDPLASH